MWNNIAYFFYVSMIIFDIVPRLCYPKTNTIVKNRAM